MVFLERGIEVSAQDSFLRDELVSEVILEVYLVVYKADHGYKINQNGSLENVFLYVLCVFT